MGSTVAVRYGATSGTEVAIEDVEVVVADGNLAAIEVEAHPPVLPTATLPGAEGTIGFLGNADEAHAFFAVEASQHCVGRDLAVGTRVEAIIDWPFRHALMRHHALLHIVNTQARDHYGGVMTGCQLGPERSRIDFKLPAFTREVLPELEDRVNEVIKRSLSLTSSIIDEDEYRRRPELVRTLNVAPPIIGGKVRIVQITGFDEQACGGTHVHSTAEIGRARLVKFDNKGKDNKRFYWELDTPR